MRACVRARVCVRTGVSKIEANSSREVALTTTQGWSSTAGFDAHPPIIKTIRGAISKLNLENR